MEDSKYNIACGTLFRKVIASYLESKEHFSEVASGVTAASAGSMKDLKTGKMVGYRLTIGDEGFEDEPEDIEEDEDE